MMWFHVDQFVRIHQTVEKRREIRTIGDVGDMLADFGLADEVQECFWVIPIDGARNVRSVFEVARGGYHDVELSIPNILAPVFTAQTDRFIVAHNHPSGIMHPTADDLDVTQRLLEAADILDLTFEDHVIVGPEGKWYSFKEHKHLTHKTMRASGG